LTKALKGKKFIGIAAGKFHTLMLTETEVYSWGLNTGQLGMLQLFQWIQYSLVQCHILLFQLHTVLSQENAVDY
jgi:alpha-tubulin suppressor-like RCC1 family protein